ncbi:hypothetical protein LX32DRAFT_653529 [Colletotrichum zoysiae]|uniref:Uncharacterized protein n=1 Tax=Colletotrichum zoysiae TaxID=1216348 RepID=A0AAD9HHD3_9PEZI|nr:hypothetical protein LX32DRAFT_653529 [Colletotrichum zoysiae]
MDSTTQAWNKTVIPNPKPWEPSLIIRVPDWMAKCTLKLAARIPDPASWLMSASRSTLGAIALYVLGSQTAVESHRDRNKTPNDRDDAGNGGDANHAPSDSRQEST